MLSLLLFSPRQRVLCCVLLQSYVQYGSAVRERREREKREREWQVPVLIRLRDLRDPCNYKLELKLKLKLSSVRTRCCTVLFSECSSSRLSVCLCASIESRAGIYNTMWVCCRVCSTPQTSESYCAWADINKGSATLFSSFFLSFLLNWSVCSWLYLAKMWCAVHYWYYCSWRLFLFFRLLLGLLLW